jgi:hypothetical protein
MLSQPRLVGEVTQGAFYGVVLRIDFLATVDAGMSVLVAIPLAVRAVATVRVHVVRLA